MSVNDHILKGSGALSGWCTGKISDVLGLFFFPLLLVSLHEMCTRKPATSQTALGAGIMTALVFGGINLFDFPARALSPWFAITPDPTDLLALPMIWVAVWWMSRSRSSTSSSRMLRFAAVAAASLSSIATSRPPVTYELARDYPIWRPESQTTARVNECVQVSWWVAKSGKQGVGVGLKALNQCARTYSMMIDVARFEVEGFRAVEASGDRALKVLEFGQVTLLYLPFVFDNEQAWNREHLNATLRLDLKVGGQPFRIEEPLYHHQRADYRCITVVRRERFDPEEPIPDVCRYLDGEVSYVKENGHDFMR